MRTSALSNPVKFAMVFLVVNLHLLRNVSVSLYLALYLLVTAYVTIQYLSKRKSRFVVAEGLAFHLWVMAALFAFATSLVLISPIGAVEGLSRFLFAAPIYMAFVLYTDTFEDLRGHLITFAGFFAIASLSLPLQFLVGPISWFASASERGGFERYASLVGSLTSIGIVVGSYIVLAQGLPKIRRLVFLPLILLPALVSLNKSAIANVAIALLVLAFLNRRSLSKLALAGIAVGCLLGAAYSVIPGVQERISASLQSFGIQAAGSAPTNYDMSFSGSAVDRIIALPKANFDSLSELGSPLVYLTGGGYGMGNTALVPESDALAPMAHNQFAELLTAFGPIAGGVQIGVLIAIGVALKRRHSRARQDVYLIVLLAYLVLMVNSIFANGTLYQPASASIFYLAMFVAFSPKTLDQPPGITGMRPLTGSSAP
ncbi:MULTISPECIES: hypothetical protein [Cryobacterium]|uniref:O-antigen ligase domain-containing protein n=1 Tax=Cryobacterium breve TaxID=1259258 RepID=A0ABY2J0P6_9MICO|nr:MULTISPECIES: hypothetical protein [Cryobacterium]TFC93277.1 hypothetical protein E3T20_10535 [Cryobacterium sp. TmT3-12]TFC97867.1 hypothetical protein E3O65_09050 [Cryobacterium breve]